MVLNVLYGSCHNAYFRRGHSDVLRDRLSYIELVPVTPKQSSNCLRIGHCELYALMSEDQ